MEPCILTEAEAASLAIEHEILKRVYRRAVKVGQCLLRRGTHRNRPLRIALHGRTRFVLDVLYELFLGPIPPGYRVAVQCRHRACLNPMHLELVTYHEKLRRGNSKWAQEARQPYCPRWHAIDAINTYPCKICMSIRKQKKQPQTPYEWHMAENVVKRRMVKKVLWPVIETFIRTLQRREARYCPAPAIPRLPVSEPLASKALEDSALLVAHLLKNNRDSY